MKVKNRGIAHYRNAIRMLKFDKPRSLYVTFLFYTLYAA